MMAAAIRAAAARLEEAGCPSPRVDAVALLAHVVGTDPGDLERKAILGSPLSREQEDRYEALVAEREQRVPLQHLTGSAHFRRLELGVGPDVFIPRPETELTVELALAVLREHATGEPTPVLVDLCCGSGAIGLAIKDEMVTAAVTCVDIAEGAVDRTKDNGSRLGLQVATVHADATSEELPEGLAELAGRADVVATNPPYVPLDAVPREPEVRDHDPRIALYGGSDDGLAIPLQVARTAAMLLRDGGTLVMEHADVQGDAIVAALQATGEWTDVEDHLDLNERPRSVTAVRAPRPGGDHEEAPAVPEGEEAADPGNDPSLSAATDEDPRSAPASVPTPADPAERPQTTPTDPRDTPTPTRHVHPQDAPERG